MWQLIGIFFGCVAMIFCGDMMASANDAWTRWGQTTWAAYAVAWLVGVTSVICGFLFHPLILIVGLFCAGYQFRVAIDSRAHGRR